jgi:hypothetical protein
MYSPTQQYYNLNNQMYCFNNYYPQPVEQERRMSYTEYLSSSNSSQGSFSDYEQSPVNISKDYFPHHQVIAGQSLAAEKFFVPSMMLPQQFYYPMMDMSPTPSMTSSPIISPMVEEIKQVKKQKKRNVCVKQKKQKEQEENTERNFPCHHEDCGKVFRRSEHLKRHIRSIHTREKRKSFVIGWLLSE